MGDRVGPSENQARNLDVVAVAKATLFVASTTLALDLFAPHAPVTLAYHRGHIARHSSTLNLFEKAANSSGDFYFSMEFVPSLYIRGTFVCN